MHAGILPDMPEHRRTLDDFSPPPAVVETQIVPEFVRLPRVGEPCPHTGLSRTALNALILPTPDNGFRPPVKSKVLRRPGNLRGIRLISYGSLISYLHSLAETCESSSRKAS